MTVKQTTVEVNARKDRILTAATEVFQRYGYARTKMSDIADACGISRPALYLLFQNKDDIFVAVIERIGRDGLYEFRVLSPSLGPLGDRLHYFCEKWGLYGYEVMQAHPDARDFFDLHFPAVQRMYDDFEDFLTEVLTKAVPRWSLKSTPRDMARNTIYAMRGFKEAAKDGSEMKRMISFQVDALITAINGH